ncbi:hypothetical protein M2437_001640 [Methylorubrum pseudosasae]|nr:hypothetical protein [Methylorubrum pseudosasae]
MRHIRGADQGEVALVGNGEDDAPVGLLQDVGLIALIESPNDDVAPLDEAHLRPGFDGERSQQGFADPRSGGVDDDPCPHALPPPPVGIVEGDGPGAFVATGGFDGGPGADLRTALGGIERVQHDEAAVLDPAIGIGEAPRQPLLKRHAGGITIEA